MKVSIASRRRNRSNLAKKMSGESPQSDVVTIAKIDSAIQSLKQAKKTPGVKFVVIYSDNENVTLRVADSSDVLDIANPSKKQAKALKIKTRKDFPRSRPNYQVEEGSEAISAIKDNLKKSLEDNGKFFAQLDASLLKR